MSLNEAIKTANAADEVFEAEIKNAGFKSRWDWDYRKPGLYVALRHAYQNKINADAVMHREFEAYRKTCAGE